MGCFSIFGKKRWTKRQRSSQHNEGRYLYHRLHSSILYSLRNMIRHLLPYMFLNVTCNSICTDLSGDISITRYTYKELVRTTENFSPSNKIGEGGFGSVHKVRYITFKKNKARVI